MPLRLSFKTLTLCLLLTSATAAGQLPQATKQESEEEKAKARKELERKALVLLDETLEGAQVLKLAENRAAVRVQAADLLWPRDEKRARALFRDAAADLATVKQGDGNNARAYWMASQLRTQLLKALCQGCQLVEAATGGFGQLQRHALRLLAQGTALGGEAHDHAGGRELATGLAHEAS